MKEALALIIVATASGYAMHIGLPLEAADCASLRGCPSEGAPCTCPDGTPSTWHQDGTWPINTELCSCDTSGCGSGPCNHKIRWKGWRSDYVCDTGCRIISSCYEGFIMVGTLNENCAGGACSGPCPNPVDPTG